MKKGNISSDLIEFLGHTFCVSSGQAETCILPRYYVDVASIVTRLRLFMYLPKCPRKLGTGRCDCTNFPPPQTPLLTAQSAASDFAECAYCCHSGPLSDETALFHYFTPFGHVFDIAKAIFTLVTDIPNRITCSSQPNVRNCWFSFFTWSCL